MQLKAFKKNGFTKENLFFKKIKKNQIIFSKKYINNYETFFKMKNLLKGYEALKQNKFKNILHLRSLIEEKFKVKKIYLFSAI